jgi:hypothetical protein
MNKMTPYGWVEGGVSVNILESNILFKKIRIITYKTLFIVVHIVLCVINLKYGYYFLLPHLCMQGFLGHPT